MRKAERIALIVLSACVVAAMAIVPTSSYLGFVLTLEEQEKADSIENSDHMDLISLLPDQFDDYFSSPSLTDYFRADSISSFRPRYGGHLFEAENFVIADATIEDNDSASGGKNVGFVQDGSKLQKTIDFESDAYALIEVCLSTSPDSVSEKKASSVFSISANGEEKNFENTTVAPTGGWTNFETKRLGVIHFAEGLNSLEITCFEGINIDYVSLVPLNSDSGPVHFNMDGRTLTVNAASANLRGCRLGESQKMAEGIISGGSLSFVVDVEDARKVNFYLGTQFPDNGQTFNERLSVYVGEQSIPLSNVEITVHDGEWWNQGVSKTFLGQVDLENGENEIQVSFSSSDSFNLAYVYLEQAS